MRRVLVAAFTLLLLSTVGTAQSNQEWIRFSPPNSDFVIMMPAQPKEQVQTKETFSTHLFTLSTDGTIYLIGYGDYAPSVKIDPQKELEANRDNFNKGVKATLLTSKSYDMDGRLGLEFTSETPKADLKSRVFIVGNRVYQIAALVFKGSNQASNVDKFLDSFVITTK